MRTIKLRLDNGARVLCNDPQHVQQLLEEGAELVNPADLELLARERAERGESENA